MRYLTQDELRAIREFPMDVPDLRTREARSAQQYMEHKGYEDVRPFGVIKVEGQGVWYFYYELEDRPALLGHSLVELEIEQGDDFDQYVGGLKRTVTAFLGISGEHLRAP